MRHLTSKTAADQVIAHMEDWLRLSPRTYTATVRLFALRLPPEKLVEALWVAADRKKDGGRDAFKYFCGVCHTMLRAQRAELQRTNQPLAHPRGN